MFSTEFSFLSRANLVFSGNDDCWMVQTESGIFCSAQMAVFEVIWKISEILINRKGKGLFCNAPWFPDALQWDYVGDLSWERNSSEYAKS